ILPHLCGMNAEIITIGDELLIGQVIDTNSAWMAQRLNEAGVRVVRKQTVGDVPEQMAEVIKAALNRSDIVLLTGGLGPTKDDKTRDVLCTVYKCGLVVDAQTLARMEAYFTARNRVLSDTNRDQANVPDKCTPIPNHHGTAPGMWFEENGKILVSMPGVPYEMKAMMDEFVIPKLRNQFALPEVFHQTIITMGITESHLSDLLSKWESELPARYTLAYLPAPGIVRLRLSCYDAGMHDANAMTELMDGLATLVQPYLFSRGDTTPEQSIGEMLRIRNQTLSVAESCTGGYVSHLITTVPGSSIWYMGSSVSYDNEVKSTFLGVDANIISTKGAVSEEVARAMAEGIRTKLKTTWSIATTGVAGPGGGTPEKPVGTVWIALSGPFGTQAKMFRFGDNRLRNIQMTALMAFKMLRDAMMETGSL
ncbi:MAG: competence/damage-inducible protein A, partial [Bacteroidota bacterium]